MFKDTKIKKEVTERHKYCDLCGIEILIGLECSAARCQICLKDLCYNCIGTEKDSTGDYRVVWCKACWTTGEKYRPKINELEEEIEKLYDAWYNEC